MQRDHGVVVPAERQSKAQPATSVRVSHEGVLDLLLLDEHRKIARRHVDDAQRRLRALARERNEDFRPRIGPGPTESATLARIPIERARLGRLCNSRALRERPQRRPLQSFVETVLLEYAALLLPPDIEAQGLRDALRERSLLDHARIAFLALSGRQ